MSTPYTPSPTYHTQIDVTVDGDFANSGEFNPPYQQCADNAAYCKQVIDPLVLGGTITPASALTINQELIVNGPLVVEGVLTVDNVVNANFAINVGGDISVAGATATIDHHLDVETVTVASAARFEGDVLAVGSTATFNCPTEIDGDLTATANTTLGTSDSDQVIIKATPTLEAPMLMALAGRVTWKTALGTGTNLLAYDEGTQFIFWGTTTLTGDISQSLGGAPGQNGDHILLTYFGTMHTLTFGLPGGQFQSMGATGTHWALWVLLGGTWRQAAAGS